MSTNYSFFNQIDNRNRVNAGQSGRRGGASNAQKNFYYDLCRSKGVRPQVIESLTSYQVGQLIEELQKLPTVASEAQVERIVELEETLKEVGVIAELTPIEDIRKLTGGEDGTASKAIDELYQIFNRVKHLVPANERQIETLIEWYLCPDIPFEDYGVSITKERPELNGWSYLSPEEFKEELEANLTREDAERLIGRYSGKYYEWLQSRLSRGQMNRIRALEERMSNTETPLQVEYAVIDGVYTQITKVPHKHKYAPKGYEGLNEYQLRMLSSEEASAYIQRLEYELEYIKGVPTQNGEEFIYSDHQDMLNEKRYASTLQGAEDEALEELRSMIYSIESIANYKDDEIHDLIDENFVLNMNSFPERVTRIQEFFLSTITISLPRNEYEEEELQYQINRIQGICESNYYADKILKFKSEGFDWNQYRYEVLRNSY